MRKTFGFLAAMCAMVKPVAILGMGDLPPFFWNPYNGYINPYYWVDEFIPYYMEIMGVDRPDRTCFSGRS